MARIYKKNGGYFLMTRDGIEKVAVRISQNWVNDPIEVVLAWGAFSTELNWSAEEIKDDLIEGGLADATKIAHFHDQRRIYLICERFLTTEEQKDALYSAAIAGTASACYLATASIERTTEYIAGGNPDRDWRASGGNAPRDFRSIQDDFLESRRAERTGNPKGYRVWATNIDIPGIGTMAMWPHLDVTDLHPFDGQLGGVKVKL